jgi:toxin ParE1/3/4
MVYTIAFSEEAEEDIANAYNWYEQELPGLGDEFIIAINTGVTSIQSNPLAYSFRKGKIRGFTIKRFPYIILYVTGLGIIEVISVFHTKRKPLA